MAWTAPTSRSTADLITQSIWNTDLVDNLNYLLGALQPNTMINRSGGTLDAGAVVVNDPSTDTSFTTTATADNEAVAGVLAESIANGAAGRVAQLGIFTVLVQGNVARGDYIATSTTTGRGYSVGATRTKGTYAQALTAYAGGGAGSVTARLVRGDWDERVKIGSTSGVADYLDAALFYRLAGTGIQPTGLAVAQPCQGRLTLTSATPVTTADVTAATNLYFTPYNGNQLSLYDGTSWRLYNFAEISLVSPALTSGKNYDVYVYDNSGTLTLELSQAWTNDTTRADALALQDGVYCKSGALTRRYVGTIRASGANQMEDSAANRLVWNLYNRVPRQLKKVDATASWAYSTGSFRSFNNSTANRVGIVCGLNDIPVILDMISNIVTSSGNVNASVGIGLDSTSALATDCQYEISWGQGSSLLTPVFAKFLGYIGLGYHYLQMLEYGGANITFYGGSNRGCLGVTWA
jgi:hypothetical protein